MSFLSAPVAAPAGPLGRRRAFVVTVLAAGLVFSACSDSERSLDSSDEAEVVDAAGIDAEDEADGALPGGGSADADLPFGDEPSEAEQGNPEPVAVEDLADLSAPEEVIAEVEEELLDEVAPDAVLDAIEPVDTGLDIVTDRQGRTTNQDGEAVGLDEMASLACANVEIALTAFDEDDDDRAAEHVSTAAEWAQASAMTSVTAWSEPLAAAIGDGAGLDVAPLIGFLSVCAEGGYEL